MGDSNFNVFTISQDIPLNPKLRVLVVSPSKLEQPNVVSEVKSIQSLMSMKIPSDFSVHGCVVHCSKDDGLPKMYNKILAEFSSEFDVVLFAHDDLVINDYLVFQHLLNAKQEGYGVVGIAGGKSWQIPCGVNPLVTPLGWTAATSTCGASGGVLHIDDNGRFFQSSYGFAPSRVLTVDGCFIAMMNDGLNLRFDEDFTFDFYDMSLCMMAYLRGVKVGVYPILCTHYSMGKGVFKPEFLESQKKFLEKYIKK